VIQHITPAQALQLISSGKVDVVDVRNPDEWATGHVAGSRLVPLGKLRAAPTASLPKDGVLFVCAAGVRSETAARLAIGLGLKKVYNLRGGIRAWNNARLGLESEVVTAVAG
jgi:rhodanese-related sulfurtransferase